MRRNVLATLGIGAVALLLVVAALTAGLGTAGAQSDGSTTADRTISVGATGEAAAAPDEAVVRVAVTATGEDPAVVRDDLATGGADLRAALDDLGATYETASYSLGEYRAHEKRPEEPAYRGRHVFTVTVDDPDRAGAVVDAAADANASVERVQLTLSDERREQLRDTAIEDAMADARHQASTIAASGDLALAGVHTVEASQQHYRPVSYEGGAAADSARSTTIDSGDVTVTYRVQVTFNATAA